MVESQFSAEWAVALFNRSVLKQAKYRKVLELLERPGRPTSTSASSATCFGAGEDGGTAPIWIQERWPRFGTWWARTSTS
jgi:hypothetical protein